MKAIVRITFILLALLLIIPVSISLFTRYYIDKKLVILLKEAAANAATGPFRLDVNELHTDLFRGTIKAQEIRLQNENDSAKFRLYKADKIEISGISIYQLWKNKIFHASYAKISGGELMFLENGISPSNNKQSEQKNKLKEILIDSVSINGTSVFLYRNNEVIPYASCTSSLKFSGCSLKNQDGKKIFRHGLQEAQLNKILLTTSDGLYRLSIPSVFLSEKNKTIKADSILYLPNYSEKEYFRKTHTQSERMIFSTSLELNGICIDSCVKNNHIAAETMKLEHMRMNAFRNKNYPVDSVPKKSIQRILKELPLAIIIDTVLVKDGYITYKELPKEAEEAGILQFESFNAKITGLRNDSAAKTLVVASSASIAGGNPMKMTLYFPMNTNRMKFDCKGSGGRNDLTRLNEALEKLTPIKIKSGQIDSLKFSFSADEEKAEGFIDFAYKDLEIEIQNKDNKGNAKTEIINTVAKLLIIKSDNPNKNGEFRRAEIDYKRKPERFIINYSWKAIESGIAEATGLPTGALEKL